MELAEPKDTEKCQCDRTNGYNITGTIENGRCIKVICNICGKETKHFPDTEKCKHEWKPIKIGTERCKTCGDMRFAGNFEWIPDTESVSGKCLHPNVGYPICPHCGKPDTVGVSELEDAIWQFDVASHKVATGIAKALLDKYDVRRKR